MPAPTKAARPAPTDAPDMARLGLPRLDMARPAGGQIFAALKAAILRMELPPGCALSEAELGQCFGASRTPVREALAQLRDAGLVTTLPSRGNFVTRLNAQKIREARFLREALEVANVTRIAEIGLNPAVEAELREGLSAQRKAIEDADDMTFQQLDDSFHLDIARATGYPRSAHVLEHEKMQLDRLRVLSLRERDHLETLHTQHCAIFEALRAGDPDRAAAATRDHLRSVLYLLDALTALHAEYFD